MRLDDPVIVALTHDYVIPELCEIGGVAGVVGMDMGKENVGILRRQLKLPNPGLKVPPRFRQGIAGVYKQIFPAAAFYHVAVEILERAARKSDRKAKNIVADFFDHKFTCHMKSCGVMCRSSGTGMEEIGAPSIKTAASAVRSCAPTETAERSAVITTAAGSMTPRLSISAYCPEAISKP